MKKIIITLLVATGPLWGMDYKNLLNVSFKLQIINKQKKGKEPTVAIYDINNGTKKFIKIFKGIIKDWVFPDEWEQSEYYEELKTVNHLYIDGSTIENLSNFKELFCKVDTLDIENCFIMNASRTIDWGMSKITISNNKLSTNAHTELSKITTNEHIIIKNNTVIENNTNN